MRWYKYLPVPSDRMGLLWTLGAIKNGCIVEYGPAGTTHFSMESLLQLNTELRSGLYTTDLDEFEVVLGDTKRLAETIREVDRLDRPQAIFVVGSSLVAITGVDLQGLCDELRPELEAELIPFDDGGFKGDYTVGIREGLRSLAANIVRPAAAPRAKTYNIIGCTVDMFNFAADIREIIRMMETFFGYRPEAVFTAGGSLEALRQASRAEFNLVLRSEGIDAAEILKERYGQPYLVGAPYGLAGTTSWLKQIEAQFSLTPQIAKIETESEKLRRHLFRLRQMLAPYRNLSALISGNSDFLLDFSPFVTNELELELNALIVNHRLPEKYPRECSAQLLGKMISSAAEQRVDALLRNDSRQVVLGDGMLLERAKPDSIKIQLANPNLDRVLLYEDTPFMGFRGGTYLVELLLNGLNANRLKLHPRF